MLRLARGVVGNYPFLFLLLLATCLVHPALAQLETATVSGQVVDPSGLGVTGAHVKLVDIDRDTSTTATTNNSGLYTFASVRPGRYRMEVDAAGFRIVNVTGLTLNVQDHIEQNFRLQIGSVAESVTVEASAQQVNTTDATVSTVVDRQFAENLPMNGRSFQTLIQLTPGVVLTASNTNDNGQFSVNGQRAASNYWMVDGVSANIGVGITGSGQPGNGLGGGLGSFSVLGGTNSLVSVDAMQEFRIQTSTFAPEFGRTPGGQISIVTRSGTNQFHGTVFDYLRNDLFDANNWFNTSVTPALPKAQERQNDFGGTLSGPILKDRTFFFFSYEGLRLRLPQTALTFVPDVTARTNAVPAMQPYLNAFPVPNGPDNTATGVAQFNASFSNPATLNAYSLRIDHKLTDKLALFGRYNYSPSEIVQRGNGSSLNDVSPIRINTQTATIGATWAISPTVANDLRFNYSRTNASGNHYADDFGSAIPLASLPFPSPFTSQDGSFFFDVFSLGTGGNYYIGQFQQNLQRQINIVDGLSLQRGPHTLKIGVDLRRLSPLSAPFAYQQEALFFTVPSAASGDVFIGGVASSLGTTFLFRNLAVYAQDTWHVSTRLSLTYGLRWDVDFSPQSLNGPNFAAVTGFNLSDLSNLALAPAGSPPYKTTHGNFAPRFGLAYQFSQNPSWQAVLRGGFGIFYDLASSEAGNIVGFANYPFGTEAFNFFTTFPLNSVQSAPPPITPPNATNSEELLAFDPNLKLPYTLQWNVAFEQLLGREQTVTASYIGSVGRRLIQSAFISSPNPNLFQAELVTNAATSNYNALQLQFQRHISHGLQVLGSYTWSHSIDTASAGSLGSASNALVSALNPAANRGPSDFDIRSSCSVGLTYDVHAPKTNTFVSAILRNWSSENIFQARSAPPVNIYYDPNSFADSIQGFETQVRPDIIIGRPFYLYGSPYPGGKAFNPEAFTAPPVDPVTGLPISQGNLPRNALRGFGAYQWDFAVHRDFPIHEAIKLQFRAEMFNVLNHPSFGQPYGDLGSPMAVSPQFGLSTQLLGQSLNTGNLGGGAFSPLYQIGGPRSIQFALKLFF